MKKTLQAKGYPQELVLLVEEGLRRYFPSEKKYPPQIYRAMNYSLFSGGKRFRPILNILTANLFGQKAEFVLPTACALEYIHTYSLIHDDLPAIDNDDLRRGKPTCHIVFGEDTAILAGDALFAEAFFLIASKQQGESERVLRVIKEIAEAAGPRGMVGGQMVDLLFSGKKVDEKTLTYIHEHKTARFIEASAKSGAILSQASEKEIEIVAKFARNLGLAFQIVDDILNVVGKTENLGKPTGSDFKRSKATFPSHFGLEESKRAAQDYIKKAKQSLFSLKYNTRDLENLADFVLERDF